MTENDKNSTNGLTPDLNSGNNGNDSGNQHQNGGGQEPAVPPSPDLPGVPSWFASDPAAAYAELEKVRAEAAKYRKEREDAKSKALEEQGEFKALYEELKQKFDAAQPKLEAYETRLQEMLENKLKSVPESIKSLLKGQEPVEALAWLEAHAADFSPKRAPNLDAGQTGDRSKNLQLDAEALAMAQKFGIDPEKFAERKNRLLGN